MKSLPKSKRDEVDVSNEFFPATPRKEFSIGLIRIVTAMVIFMAGGVLGLSVSSTFTRYYPLHTDVFFPETRYISNSNRDCSGIRNFVKPAQVNHNMNDQQLFWRGSMVPTIKDYPFRRVPKVAFMFMTRGSIPLQPLWDKFFDGHEKYFSVYVHTAPGYKLNVSKTSAFYRQEIPSQVP